MPVDPNRATAIAIADTAGTTTTMVAPSFSLTSSQPSSPRPIYSIPQPPPHPHQLHRAVHFPSQSLYTAQALPFRSPNPRPNSQSSIPHLPKGIGHFSTDQMVTVSTHGGCGVRPRGSPHSYYLNHPVLTSQHNSQHPHMGSAIIGVPVSSHSKIAPRKTVSRGNGCKDRRDRSRDDNFIIIEGRNVRITEDASLYALCRSWLRNITHQDWQIDHFQKCEEKMLLPTMRREDVIKELPKPLSASVMSSYMSNKIVEEEREDEKSVENLTPRDILLRHIKRSKKVRGRLREERLQRIARYRSRLSLLLPPPAEQFRYDKASGN